MIEPDDVTHAVEAAVGRPLDRLDAAEATAVAARLRSIVETLSPPDTPPDARVATRLTEAAELLERGTPST